MSEQKSFFSTLPGILTGLAAVITAVVGLIYALVEIGVIGSRENIEPQPEAALAEMAVSPNQSITINPDNPMKQTTDGWAKIGFYNRGKFVDLKLLVQGDSPAIGRRYDVIDDFRLVQKTLKQNKRKAVITLGMVHRGDSVKILDIEIKPSTNRVPVWAKLRAVLHKK